jgi:hypothetical protein
VGTLTVSARQESHLSLRPVPWRRMVWVVWRQHRLALAGVAALFGVAGAYLLITGLQMYGDYASVTACRPAASEICVRAATDFLAAHAPGAGISFALLQMIPALVGAFLGAPLIAREFETGTFRYAWTQGFGRTRWAVANLVPLAIVVTVAAGLFSLVVSWYFAPLNGAGDDNGPLYPTIFDLLGVAFAAWTLAAFAIGALAGVLIRRVIPAMVTTMAVWAGLALATGLFLRPHYMAPLTTGDPNAVAHGDWVMSQVWTQSGQPVTLDMLNRTLGAVDVRAITPQLFQPGPSTPASLGDPVQYLIQHGYTYLTTYQPASRFWTFQWIEGGGLLVLSLLLIATTLWLVRRRAV